MEYIGTKSECWNPHYCRTYMSPKNADMQGFNITYNGSDCAGWPSGGEGVLLNSADPPYVSHNGSAGALLLYFLFLIRHCTTQMSISSTAAGSIEKMKQNLLNWTINECEDKHSESIYIRLFLQHPNYLVTRKLNTLQ